MRTMYNLVGRGAIRTTGWPMHITRSELEDFSAEAGLLWASSDTFPMILAPGGREARPPPPRRGNHTLTPTAPTG